MAQLRFRIQKVCFIMVVNLSIVCPSWAVKEETDQQDVLPLEDVQRFSTAIGQVKNFYVNKVDDSQLFENAIRGMLSGLDPHSAYLDREEFSELKSQNDGEFGGLGLEVAMEEGYIRVVSPIDDTPAEHAGIQPGDMIVKLNDKSVKGMTLRDAVNVMRGPKGSSIELTILRKNEKKLSHISILRDIIEVKSVKSQLLENDYGYLRVSYFQAKTYEHLKNSIDSLNKMNKHSLKGVVLDLRNNPGGLLDAAIDVSDAFLDSHQLKKNKLIVYTKGRIPGADIQAKASPGDLLNGIPMVVLINQGSASGSEIVAGALQDHKRAILMGETSFGKGSVQTVLPLDENRGVKITTALYYTPLGRSIQAKGIKPDILVGNMKVSANNRNNNLTLALIRESDLDNHLANGNLKDKVVEPKDKQEDTANHTQSKQLAMQDYELNEALNLLKALNVVTSARHS